MNCWFVLQNKFGKYISVTAKKNTITGYNNADLKYFGQIVYVKDKEKFDKWFGRNKFYHSSLTYRIISKDNKIIWVRSYTGIIGDDICSFTVKLPLAHLIIYKLKSLFVKNPSTDFKLNFCISKHNKEGVFLDISGGYHTIIKYPVSQLQRSDVYKKIIHPDDRTKVYQEAHIKTINDIPEITCRIKNNNDKYVWVKSYSTMIDNKYIYALTVKVNYFVYLFSKLNNFF